MSTLGAWETLDRRDSPGADVQPNMDANVLDDDRYDTPESVEKTFAFIKQSLSGMGLGLDQLDFQSKDTQDVARLCRCLLALVRQRQVDARQKNELRDEGDKLRSRAESADRNVKLLERRLEARHQEVGDLTIQLRKLVDAHNEERGGVSRERAELGRHVGDLVARQKASEHLARRKEAECERVQEKLRTMSVNRGGGGEGARGGGQEVVAGARRARLNGRQPGAFETQEHLLEDARRRAEELTRTNTQLRRDLANLQAQHCQLMGRNEALERGEMDAGGPGGSENNGSPASLSGRYRAAGGGPVHCGRMSDPSGGSGQRFLLRSSSVEDARLSGGSHQRRPLAAASSTTGCWPGNGGNAGGGGGPSSGPAERLAGRVHVLQTELAASRRIAADQQKAASAALSERDRALAAEQKALTTARRSCIQLQAAERAARDAAATATQQQRHLHAEHQQQRVQQAAAAAEASHWSSRQASDSGDAVAAAAAAAGLELRLAEASEREETALAELKECQAELAEGREQLAVLTTRLSAATTKVSLMNTVVSMTFRGAGGGTPDLAKRVAALVKGGVDPVHDALLTARTGLLRQTQVVHELEAELSLLRRIPASPPASPPPRSTSPPATRPHFPNWQVFGPDTGQSAASATPPPPPRTSDASPAPRARARWALPAPSSDTPHCSLPRLVGGADDSEAPPLSTQGSPSASGGSNRSSRASSYASGSQEHGGDGGGGYDGAGAADCPRRRSSYTGGDATPEALAARGAAWWGDGTGGGGGAPDSGLRSRSASASHAGDTPSPAPFAPLPPLPVNRAVAGWRDGSAGGGSGRVSSSGGANVAAINPLFVYEEVALPGWDRVEGLAGPARLEDLIFINDDAPGGFVGGGAGPQESPGASSSFFMESPCSVVAAGMPAAAGDAESVRR